MSRQSRTLLILIVTAICLLAAAASFVALPFIVRALPGRYAYYLPDFLQAWRQVEHPDTLPTPIPVDTPDFVLPPTLTPTPPLASPTPMPTLPPLPASYILGGAQHEPQGWNNCGPTTLAMALSFWGRPETQREVAPALKPDPEDKNVGPYEMAEYVRSLGLEVVVRVGGDLDLIKQLLVAGFPVIVETWHVEDGDDQMGHYRLIIGYDDAIQQFNTHDSLNGPDLPIGYQELDELWLVFDRVYLVAYPPEESAELETILGPRMDEGYAFELALEIARQEAIAPPDSCVAYVDCADAEAFAWFNIGTNLVALGQFEEASAAYDRARILGLPWRMLWYQFGPYEAYYAVGRYEDVVALTSATLAVVNNLEESYYWRGLARQAQGDIEGARADFNTALRYHSGWGPATEALAELGE